MDTKTKVIGGILGATVLLSGGTVAGVVVERQIGNVIHKENMDGEEVQKGQFDIDFKIPKNFEEYVRNASSTAETNDLYIFYKTKDSYQNGFVVACNKNSGEFALIEKEFDRAFNEGMFIEGIYFKTESREEKTFVSLNLINPETMQLNKILEVETTANQLEFKARDSSMNWIFAFRNGEKVGFYQFNIETRSIKKVFEHSGSSTWARGVDNFYYANEGLNLQCVYINSNGESWEFELSGTETAMNKVVELENSLLIFRNKNFESQKYSIDIVTREEVKHFKDIENSYSNHKDLVRNGEKLYIFDSGHVLILNETDGTFQEKNFSTQSDLKIYKNGIVSGYNSMGARVYILKFEDDSVSEFQNTALFELKGKIYKCSKAGEFSVLNSITMEFEDIEYEMQKTVQSIEFMGKNVFLNFTDEDFSFKVKFMSDKKIELTQTTKPKNVSSFTDEMVEGIFIKAGNFYDVVNDRFLKTGISIQKKDCEIRGDYIYFSKSDGKVNKIYRLNWKTFQFECYGLQQN